VSSMKGERRELKKRARDAFDRIQAETPSLTQAGLARELGLSRATVSKVLNSQVDHVMTIEFAVGLSNYIDLSLSEIFQTPAK